MKRRILIFFGILILALIGFITLNTNDNKNTKDIIIKPKEVIKIDEDNNETYVSPIEDLISTYNNSDIIAELKITSIGLSEVITKTSNNEFYLNHNIYKKNSSLGNPYIDYRNGNNLDKERQINIYGHNTYKKSIKDKYPFSKLESYLDKDTFNNSDYIYLYTKDKLIKYEVYAVKIVTTDNEHTILDSRSEDKWNSHLDKLLTNTLYCRGNCSLKSDDELLILQTCYFKPSNSYILVIARKVI